MKFLRKLFRPSALVSAPVHDPRNWQGQFTRLISQSLPLRY